MFMERGSTAVIVVVIITAVIIMFIFPLNMMAGNQDNISQLAIQQAVTEFTNEVRKTGVLTQLKYDNLIQTLAATGNSYDVEITIQKLDENPAKKTSGSTTTIGDNVYYVMYTTQVLEEITAQNGLKLNEGDIILVTAENTNQTIASQLRNFIYKVTGNNSANIVAQESGMVTKSAN